MQCVADPAAISDLTLEWVRPPPTVQKVQVCVYVQEREKERKREREKVRE